MYKYINTKTFSFEIITKAIGFVMTFDNQAEIICTSDRMMIISFFINIIVFGTQFISSAPKHVQPTDKHGKQTIQTVH